MTKEQRALIRVIAAELGKMSPADVAKTALYFYGVDELAGGMIRDLREQGSIEQMSLALNYIEKL